MTTDAPAFAFLHGGAQGSWVWERTASALHELTGAESLLLDVPGCGVKRGMDTNDISFADIVSGLLAEIEAWGRLRIVLVGHSQAGTVLPRLAEAKPGLFARLVYLTCSLPLPGQTVIEMIGTSVHGENPDEVGWPYDRSSAHDAQWAAMFTDGMDAETKREFRSKSPGQSWPQSAYAHRDWAYPEAPVPSTYIVCDRDRALPTPWQEVFAERLHCEHTLRMDADHQAMLTQPRELAELLLSELQSADRH